MMNERNKELQAWKDAMWDYLVEHSDLTERGSFFVKFHTRTRSQFEGHVASRIRGYHRKDSRSNFTNEQKEKDAKARREAHESEKLIKKKRKEDAKKRWKENGWTKQNSILPLEEQKRAIAEMKKPAIHRWLGRIGRMWSRTGILVKGVVMRTANSDSVLSSEVKGTASVGEQHEGTNS